jgi:hydrophobe/amphiphile efflux-3 (HAE3) family protein
MKKIFEIVTAFPKTTILLIVALTLVFGSQLANMRMETDAESMIPQGHPAIVYSDKVEEIFGIQDAIIIGIVNEEPSGIFTPHTLELIKRLTGEIASLEGVVAITDDDVVSLATIDNIIGTEFGFEVSPFMEEIPATESEIAELKRKIYDNGMYTGGIISEDGTATAIFAELENGLKSRAMVYNQIKEIINLELQGGGPEKIYVAGRPVLEVTFGEYMSQDMQKMMPLVLVVIILVLFLTFRSLRGVLLPLSVVVGSVIWAMGTMTFFNIPLFTISTQMPIILMAVGTAYGIHILNKYYQEVLENPEREKREVILETMREIWKPVVMTALTTAVGFFSLITAYMVPIRYFGIFTAVGVLAAMIFSVALIPASLMLIKMKVGGWKSKDRKIGEEMVATGWSAKILSLGGEFIHDRRKAVTLATTVIMIASLIGILNISTNSSWIESIKHSSEVYVANKVLNEKFDGTLNLYIIVEGEEADAIKSPTILKEIDGLQQDVEQMSLVGGSRSIAEYMKRMNRVMNEDRKEFEKIPDSRELVAQYLLMYSMSGDPDDFDDVIDYDYRQANIWVQVKSDYTDDIASVINRVKAFADQHFSGDKVKVNLAGRVNTSYVWVDLLIRGQMNSILFSIISVFLITALMFRSFVAGIFNIIPISAAMLLNFGIMGLLGIPLDVATALSSGIVIGVGIDYTIHFLSKYHWEVDKLKDGRKATVLTMMTTGKAIFFNAFAVIAGFMVLFASNFPANRHLGLLVAFNMFTSFFAAMTILPALLNIVKPKFIFEALNRGEESQ